MCMYIRICIFIEREEEKEKYRKSRPLSHFFLSSLNPIYSQGEQGVSYKLVAVGYGQIQFLMNLKNGTAIYTESEECERCVKIAYLTSFTVQVRTTLFPPFMM